MRIRIVMSGIFAGVICISALWLPWYMEWPSEFTAEWKYFNYARNFPRWLETGMMVFCGVTLFAFGWTAARWNWEKNWRDSLLAGGEMGLIAGCIVYDLIGAFHYGLLGQSEVLGYFYVELTRMQGLTMLANAIFRSAGYMYQAFFIMTGASVIVGALGGLASAFDLEDVWGSLPRTPQQWLFRLPAYTLVISGVLYYYLTAMVFSVFRYSVTDLVSETDASKLDLVYYLIFQKAPVFSAMIALLPLGITWGWIIRAWRGAKLWRVLYALWGLVSLGLAGWLVISFFRTGRTAYSFSTGFLISYYELIVAVCALAAGVVLGMLSGSITAPDSKYHFSDWLGYLLAQGIIGGTQIFVSVPAYALVISTVSIPNIPHLTFTGLSTASIANQISRLFLYLNALACSGFVLCILGGIIASGSVTLIRKFLKIAPPPIPQDAPVFVD
jgi:hypothetical protein